MGGPQALDGIRVVDLATLIAGPTCARWFADFGADVIKVERPDGGDPVREFEFAKDGVSLWWKCVSRNKMPVTLNLKHPDGVEVLMRLVETADALVENFRPGTLERLGIGPDVMLDRNPGLVVTRISAFGQDGPYARRPGFGTLAEAISGYADLTGFADLPPLLPPIALADEVTGIQAAFATLAALRYRDTAGADELDGGQIIDMSLYESLFGLLGPLPTQWQQNGELQARQGSRLPFSAPRNAFRTSDNRYVAVSGSSPTAATRILRAIGRDDLIHSPKFKDNVARVAHSDELDELIESWIGEHSLGEVLETFDAHGAAAAPILDMQGIFADEHYRARGSITTVPDDELGDIAMQNVGPRLSRTPARIRHAGAPLGSGNESLLTELGYTEEEIAQLRDSGAV